MNIKQIDFLPERYREREKQRHSQAWRSLVLVLFGGAICAVTAMQIYECRQLQHQLDDAMLGYQAVQADDERLANLQQAQRDAQAQAQLLTFLRHPWPRSQILGQLTAPLPDEVVLDRIRLVRETARDAASAAAPTVTDAPTATIQNLPAESDLIRLRDETDKSRIVVLLDGTTSDDAALHSYLGRLAREPLWERQELTSLESSERGLHFTIRIEVRNGYGQRRGPSGPPRNERPEVLTQLSPGNPTPRP
jgi:Tfp pilus assembly protein PilN